MAEPIRRETEDERRRRELADSLEYAAKAARDPALARRVAEARADMAAGGLNEATLISYEDLAARIRAAAR